MTAHNSWKQINAEIKTMSSQNDDYLHNEQLKHPNKFCLKIYLTGMMFLCNINVFKNIITMQWEQMYGYPHFNITAEELISME